MSGENSTPFDSPRRQFLKSTAAVAGVSFVRDWTIPHVHAAGSELVRVGLIGCGGRGTGAAAQALRADPQTRLVALADVFEDRLANSLASLQQDEVIAGRIDVPESRRHVGFDAYRQLIDGDVDVVLLCEPPHFRPRHLRYAIEAGKHVFAEKPVAVDAPGVQSVLASCELAATKRLSVVSGLCLRYSRGFRETIARLHEQAIGQITTLQANDFRGPIWVRPRQPDWTDMHWQMRNWYYFTWLSGDFNVEQHVHLLDVCSWVMRDEYPVKAIGSGGRQVRTGEQYGNIYDHHSVIYEYANGTKLFSHCRQQPGCHNEIAAYATGTRGHAQLREGRLAIFGESTWRFREGDQKDNFYQTEHDELFASIRAGQPLNNGDYMAKSTLLAIMGRMATYTGQQVTWEQALNSKEDLTPERYDWGPIPSPPIAIPGVTKLA